jgi:hypothetical protein
MKTVEKLLWSAKDGGVDLEEAKLCLSVWDSKSKEMRIDLWTKRSLLMK